jgi:hypothetical protein
MTQPDPGVTPDPTPTPAPAADPKPADDPKPVTAEDVARLQRALDSERDARKTAEKTAREATQQARAALPEAERAAAEAREEGRKAALAEFGGRLVDAELRAAAAGRPVDVDALLEAVDRSRFVNDAGEVDRKALGAWVDRIAPAPQETTPVVPSFDGGTRTPAPNNSTASQFAKAIGTMLT